MALEELSFESVNKRTDTRMDGWTEDGQKLLTIAHPEHSSGELKIGQFFISTRQKNFSDGICDKPKYSVRSPDQTVQTQIRCHRTWHLIRVYTVCHSSSNLLDTSTGSTINFFKLLKY